MKVLDKFYENDVVIVCNEEEATILFESEIDKYIVVTKNDIKYEVNSKDIKLIKPYLLTRILNLKNKDCEILKAEFRTLQTLYGEITIYDIKIRKNDYIFSCFADTETVIKQMKIDGLL